MRCALPRAVDWACERGLDVVVEGEAVRVTDNNLLRRLAEVWATKWDGRRQLEARDGCFRNRNASNWPSQVFSVKPAKVFAHAKGDPFGAATHRF